MKSIDRSKIADGVTERVCESLRAAVRELQGLPGIERDIIRDVVVDGTTVNNPTNVPHKLGRAPRMVVISAPRVKFGDLGTVTPGQVLDSGARTFADQPFDRARMVQIGAFGWAVSITVDVEVW